MNTTCRSRCCQSPASKLCGHDFGTAPEPRRYTYRMPSEACIGRVGGLAVALGVGVAIVTGWSNAPAWADDSPGSTESPSASKDSGPDATTGTKDDAGHPRPRAAIDRPRPRSLVDTVRRAVDDAISPGAPARRTTPIDALRHQPGTGLRRRSPSIGMLKTKSTQLLRQSPRLRRRQKPPSRVRRQ